jgi:CDP-diacylglycerol---glycerol-3-phosphate 3-phosphatidyltransferase
MNLPNRLTVSRLVVAVGLFVMLELIRQASSPSSQLLQPWKTTLASIAFILFLLAAFTDVLDGYLARRRRLTSDFGRIADPFADKVLICGSLVFLSATEDLRGLIPPWVVVVILSREFLVTGLRGYIEARGLSFGARAAGKLKMLLQSVLVGGALFVMGPGYDQPQLRLLLLVIMIAAVAITMYSGWIYIKAASRVLARDTKPEAHPASDSRPDAPDPAKQESSS